MQREAQPASEDPVERPGDAPAPGLRVLSLSNTPADPATGSGYVTRGFAEGLRSRGHAVVLLDPADYQILPRLNRARQYTQPLGMARRVGREVRAFRPDVVELWGGEAWLAAARLRRRTGRRFLLVARSNGLEPHVAAHFEAAHRTGEVPRPSWYHLDQTRWVESAFRAADALVTVSAFDRDFALGRRYLAPERVLALPNPLPPAYLGLPAARSAENAIGFCGSWIPRKGTWLVEQALPPVLREFPDWRLVLVGVGEGFEPRAHFPPDVLDQIEVHPHADRTHELISLYRSMALLVMPSIYESFGLVSAEAMACATPVLAPPTGFLASLDEDREFLKLADRQVETFVEGLRRAILDPDLRASVGLAGRRRVQSLCWSDALDRIEAAYRSWLTERRADENRPDRT